MKKEQKIALAKEMLTNMNLTKEQYLEMCRLVDDLDLEPKSDEPEDREISWEDLFNEIDITNK